MRKAKWVAAAAGVVLLVAGCGSGGGSDKGGSSSASGGSTAGGSASAGSTGGSEAGGELTAEAVKKEIETAATGAGFVQDATGDAVPAGLEKCMVSWSADAKKAADPKKSYADTVAGLGKVDWKTDKTFEQSGSTIKTLSKGDWQLKASDHSVGVLKMVMFIASNNTPECQAAFAADLAKNKKS
ncbi:hypothetical protein ACIGO8_23265 [Streptomyces sp. NPDC053493]|uniref:hypothetical protein n=1 Tax=Streptomyces sp. NPDC053493 TaxID=3365705 RepID=UPI0037CF793A